MLKTLRVTSLVTVILAVIGVIAIIAMGLKGDPEIRDYLAKPGIVAELRGQIGQNSTEEKSSPLVALAQKIALRFDPPPPPKPVVKDTPPAEVARVNPTTSIPRPKVQVDAKFNLLATVVYETAPAKSLALLKTTDKQEWFREGEKAGHLELQEIRDGSVVFDQGGGKTQEIFVPEKPQIKSLLKESNEPVSTSGGLKSITDTLLVSGQAQTVDTDKKSPVTSGASQRTASGKVRMIRPRSNVSERIERVRSTPPEPSPKEKKRSVEKTMQEIEEIMHREGDSVSGEKRKEENEMWMELLKKLNAEKKQLDAAVETNTAEAKESPEKDKQ